MTKSRKIQRPRHAWTEGELAQLRRDYPRTLTATIAQSLGLPAHMVYTKARKLGLFKDRDFVVAVAREQVLQNGRAHRFQPGHESPTKGTAGVCGVTAGSRSTQFKPGYTGHAWLPVGSLRQRSDGYLCRKVSDTRDRNVDWQPVHRLVWEAAHGPIPAGHFVVFLPGRRTADVNLITLDVLECIPHSEVARRYLNQIPLELRQVMQLTGAITRQINKRLKEQSQ